MSEQINRYLCLEIGTTQEFEHKNNALASALKTVCENNKNILVYDCKTGKIIERYTTDYKLGYKLSPKIWAIDNPRG